MDLIDVVNLWPVNPSIPEECHQTKEAKRFQKVLEYFVSKRIVKGAGILITKVTVAKAGQAFVQCHTEHNGIVEMKHGHHRHPEYVKASDDHHVVEPRIIVFEKEILHGILLGIGRNQAKSPVQPDPQGHGAEGNHTNKIEIVSTTDTCVEPEERKRETFFFAYWASNNVLTKHSGDRISWHMIRLPDNASIVMVDVSNTSHRNGPMSIGYPERMRCKSSPWWVHVRLKSLLGVSRSPDWPF